MKIEELTEPSGLIVLLHVGVLLLELYCHGGCKGGGSCMCMVYKTFQPSLILFNILSQISHR